MQCKSQYIFVQFNQIHRQQKCAAKSLELNKHKTNTLERKINTQTKPFLLSRALPFSSATDDTSLVYPDAMRTRISAMTAVELSGEDLNAVNFLANSPVKTVELP